MLGYFARSSISLVQRNSWQILGFVGGFAMPTSLTISLLQSLGGKNFNPGSSLERVSASVGDQDRGSENPERNWAKLVPAGGAGVVVGWVTGYALVKISKMVFIAGVLTLAYVQFGGSGNFDSGLAGMSGELAKIRGELYDFLKRREEWIRNLLHQDRRPPTDDRGMLVALWEDMEDHYRIATLGFISGFLMGVFKG